MALLYSTTAVYWYYTVLLCIARAPHDFFQLCFCALRFPLTVLVLCSTAAAVDQRPPAHHTHTHSSSHTKTASQLPFCITIFVFFTTLISIPAVAAGIITPLLFDETLPPAHSHGLRPDSEA